MPRRPVPVEAYPVRTAKLTVPPVADVQAALTDVLRENYAEASVDIVDCPDLRAWGLCQAGLSLDAKNVLVDVGGEPFNHDPFYNQTVKFSMDKVAEAAGFAGAKILAAGACAAEVIDGHWGEMTATLDLKTGENKSKSATVRPDRSSCQQDYPSLLHGGLCNLHLSDGASGKVFRIRIKGRKGDQISLPQTLRKGLAKFPECGLGGVFKVLNGKVKAHIQPDLCMCPEGYYDIGKMCCTKPFLRFYEGEESMGPDLVCISSMWSGDPTGGALHLRGSGEHTHFFSESQKDQTGHYHGDTTPEDIEYEGYFVLGTEIARVRDAVAEKLADREPMPTVAVLGAGALGAAVAALLHEGGVEVTLVDADAEHVQAVQQKGLQLGGVGSAKTVQVPATADAAAAGPVDVVLVCGPAEASACKGLCKETSVVVSLQRGLGHAEALQAALGDDKVLGGSTGMGAVLEAPGVVRVDTPAPVLIGEWQGGASQRCGRLAKVFADAGLPTWEETAIKAAIEQQAA